MIKCQLEDWLLSTAHAGHSADERNAQFALVRRGIYLQVKKSSLARGRSRGLPNGKLRAGRNPTWRKPSVAGKIKYDLRAGALEHDRDGGIVVSNVDAKSHADRIRFFEKLEAEATSYRANAVVFGRGLGELPYDVEPEDRREILLRIKRGFFDELGLPVHLVSQVPPVAEARQKGKRRHLGDERNYHLQAVWSPITFSGQKLPSDLSTGPRFTAALKAVLARAVNETYEKRGIEKRVTVSGGRSGSIHLGYKAGLRQLLPKTQEHNDQFRANEVNDPDTWSTGIMRLSPSDRIEAAARHQANRENEKLEVRKVRAKAIVSNIPNAMLAHRSAVEALERTAQKSTDSLKGAKKRARRAQDPSLEPAPPTDSQESLLLDLFGRKSWEKFKSKNPNWWRDEELASEVWGKARKTLANRRNQRQHTLARKARGHEI